MSKILKSIKEFFWFTFMFPIAIILLIWECHFNKEDDEDDDTR